MDYYNFNEDLHIFQTDGERTWVFQSKCSEREEKCLFLISTGKIKPLILNFHLPLHYKIKGIFINFYQFVKFKLIYLCHRCGNWDLESYSDFLDVSDKIWNSNFDFQIS